MSGTRFLFLTGSASAAIAVAAGAFGAHALRGAYPAEMLVPFETASRYQMYHALGLLAAAWGSGHWTDRKGLFNIMGYLFIAGTILFSGSLYAYVLLDLRWIVFLTPVGGMLLIAGWLMPLGMLRKW